MRARRAADLVATALLALALGACARDGGGVEATGASGAMTPAYGDTFIEPLLGNISGLIPQLTSDSASHEVAGLLYDALVTYDRDLRVIPALARAWRYSEDCRQLTFELRQDVRWHDGRPFTAADVAFTYAAMIDPRTPSAYKEDFYAIERLETPDPATVRITYRVPYAKALHAWASTAILPRHLLEPWVHQGRLREAPQNWSQPVGTGPYRFKEMRPGERIVLVANPDYFEGRPYLSRVVFRVIPSQATIFLELKAQGLDTASLTALQFARQTEYPAFRKAYRKFRYPANAYTYIGFNLRDPRFRDVRVRRALAHAIDKRELLQGIILGLGREVTGPFRPGTAAYDPAVPAIPYDPARARQLLAEAGWRERNAEGLLVKDGQPFTFTLMTNQGNDERRKIAELVQAAWRDLGIGAEIRIMEWAAFIKEYVKKRRFDAVVLGWALGLDPDQFNIWHSSKTGPEDLNFISYANPEVDELLERGRTTCDPERRAAYYRRIHAILAEEQPLLFLYSRDALPAVAARVHGIVPSPHGIRYNFREWFVPAPLQRYTAE